MRSIAEIRTVVVRAQTVNLFNIQASQRLRIPPNATHSARLAQTTFCCKRRQAKFRQDPEARVYSHVPEAKPPTSSARSSLDTVAVLFSGHHQAIAAGLTPPKYFISTVDAAPTTNRTLSYAPAAAFLRFLLIMTASTTHFRGRRNDSGGPEALPKALELRLLFLQRTNVVR